MEAKLKLEELRRQTAPRHLDRVAFLRELEGRTKAAVEIVYVRDDPECFDLAQQIFQALKTAEWPSAGPLPIQGWTPNKPTAMAIGAQPSGVTVMTHSVSEMDSEYLGQQIASRDRSARAPWFSLMEALLASVGKAIATGGGEEAPTEGTVRIVVAPRM